MYDVTPDWHPLLGDSGEVENLVLATGGSGHCFKLGPAIGDLVAASILGGKVAYAEIESFSPARFEAGREFRSTFGGNRA
jgi:glycine/D-amino acid oxidase-like deaminating enzyme